MADYLITMAPFLLLIVVFVVGSIWLAKGFGGENRGYLGTMQDQTNLMQARLAQDHDTQEILKRQTLALERIAAALESRNAQSD